MRLTQNPVLLANPFTGGFKLTIPEEQDQNLNKLENLQRG